MKSTHMDPEVFTVTYPRLMTYKQDGPAKEFTVLFTSYKKGTVVWVHNDEDCDWSVGEFIDSWVMSEFEYTLGKIVLENN